MLEPIWESSNPTAQRLRGYVETLLDYAVDALDQERKGQVHPKKDAVAHQVDEEKAENGDRVPPDRPPAIAHTGEGAAPHPLCQT